MPISLQQIAWLSQILAPVVLLVAAIIALRAKQVDILMECHRRFSDIIARAPNVRSQTEAHQYFELFWSLQLDQFTFWVRGYVDDATFNFWMEARKSEYVANRLVGDVHYQDGWSHVKEQWSRNQENRFTGFMDKVLRDRWRWTLPAIEGGRTLFQRLTKRALGD